jgi:ATP-dependent Clp protease ATP-binding subunit ClpA
VVEPSVEQTIEILKGLKSRFEDHHNVKYAVGALQAAAELAAKYINDRHLPDKAIDVIDEAGAAQRILPKNKQKKTITRLEVEEIVAKIARIPPASVSSDDRGKLKSLDRDLKSVVFGQEPAIEALASAIKMARSGLGKPDRPIGSFLFSGPTGVGKTEVAKQLAYIMGIELIRFDMSEYMERHAVSRLIGAPPGYVGFDQGGLLTEAISKKPHAVLLLDEIEKAHPDVFNVLLQVLDDGRLTDGQGRTVDFKNTVIVMTSNIGSHMIMQMAGQDSELIREAVMAEVKGHFRPEFLNRIDETVVFHALGREHIASIAKIQLKVLEARLEKLEMKLDVSAAALAELAKVGFDPVFGARPLKRAIQQRIENPVSKLILQGRFGPKDVIPVDVEGGEFSFARVVH